MLHYLIGSGLTEGLAIERHIHDSGTYLKNRPGVSSRNLSWAACKLCTNGLPNHKDRVFRPYNLLYAKWASNQQIKRWSNLRPHPIGERAARRLCGRRRVLWSLKLWSGDKRFIEFVLYNWERCRWTNTIGFHRDNLWQRPQRERTTGWISPTSVGFTGWTEYI